MSNTIVNIVLKLVLGSAFVATGTKLIKSAPIKSLKH